MVSSGVLWRETLQNITSIYNHECSLHYLVVLMHCCYCSVTFVASHSNICIHSELAHESNVGIIEHKHMLLNTCIPSSMHIRIVIEGVQKFIWENRARKAPIQTNRANKYPSIKFLHRPPSSSCQTHHLHNVHPITFPQYWSHKFSISFMVSTSYIASQPSWYWHVLFSS